MGGRTNYARGRDREYQAIEVLTSKGYVAKRNAGSHGAWDITAIAPDEVLLVQAKSEYEAVAAAMDRLRALQTPDCVRKEVWEKEMRGWRIWAVHNPR